MKKAILGMLCMVLPAMVIVSMMSLSRSQFQDTSSGSSGSLNLQDYTVLSIGGGNNLSTQVINKIRDLGAKVTSSNELLEFMEFNDSLIVMFDTEWIQEEINDTRLHDLLRNAAPKEVKLIAIGGNTSKLFEALDKAGVCRLPVTETGEVRNPAYFNPPMVGYKLRKATRPDGTEYFGDSILLSSTPDIDQLVQALIKWK